MPHVITAPPIKLKPDIVSLTHTRTFITPNTSKRNAVLFLVFAIMRVFFFLKKDILFTQKVVNCKVRERPKHALLVDCLDAERQQTLTLNNKPDETKWVGG